MDKYVQAHWRMKLLMWSHNCHRAHDHSQKYGFPNLDKNMAREYGIPVSERSLSLGFLFRF